MLVDLHTHFPMHVAPGRAGKRMDRLDVAFLSTVGRVLNHASLRSGPRVTIDGLKKGGVGVALSALCIPMLEFGDHLVRPYRRRPPYGSPPRAGYHAAILRQLEAVERCVDRHDADQVTIVRDPAGLDSALDGGSVALVHCLEGGFSLGATAADVDRNVTELAARGVAYITVAHLFWRHFATNVACVPPMPERWYARAFPQPAGVGLTDLGRAAIVAMVREGVLLDMTHMSARSLDDSFALLDELDPQRTVPVIASHCGYRFGSLQYNLSTETVQRIAARGGVVGLILSSFFARDGLRERHTATLEDSLEVLFAHVDRIAQIAGSHEHAALGSDLDGFVKPTLAGLDDSRSLAALDPALAKRYGPEIAAQIASGNALRVLRAGWGRGAPGAATTAGDRRGTGLPR